MKQEEFNDLLKRVGGSFNQRKALVNINQEEIRVF